MRISKITKEKTEEIEYATWLRATQNITTQLDTFIAEMLIPVVDSHMDTASQIYRLVDKYANCRT